MIFNSKNKSLVVIIALCLLFSLLLSSCGNLSSVDTSGSSIDSDGDSGAVDTTPEIDPDDIVYEDEDLPRVYITTEDNFQVTSKDVYSECTFRLESNDRFSVYQSTYTDTNGGSAQLRARGNVPAATSAT